MRKKNGFRFYSGTVFFTLILLLFLYIYDIIILYEIK